MSWSRRALLARLGAVTGLGVTALTGAVLAGCGPPGGGRAASGATRHRYGDDPSQYGELYEPRGHRRAGTVVVLHGGFWSSGYGLELGAPLAADLARRGWTAWNLEYRRVGNGGGWPATLADVAAGVDRLATLTPRPDLRRVVAVGHSAGGQLAAWAAARPGLPAGAPGGDRVRVRVTGVVAQAGVLDLRRAATTGVGGTAEADLLGGDPAEVPDRYAIASPIERLPLHVPVRCVHARADTNVPYEQSTRYVAAARSHGDDATLTTVPGDHFTLIDPKSRAWQAVLGLLPELLRP